MSNSNIIPFPGSGPRQNEREHSIRPVAYSEKINSLLNHNTEFKELCKELDDLNVRFATEYNPLTPNEVDTLPSVAEALISAISVQLQNWFSNHKYIIEDENMTNQDVLDSVKYLFQYGTSMESYWRESKEMGVSSSESVFKREYTSMIDVQVAKLVSKLLLTPN